MAKVLKSGPGWRLGWHPEAIGFQGLVGTDDWAIELTAPELADFCRLTQQLADTMAAMATELMDQETLRLEAETDRLWVEVEGFPQVYSLRFMLSGDRRAEGYWCAAVMPELLPALTALPVGSQGEGVG